MEIYLKGIFRNLAAGAVLVISGQLFAAAPVEYTAGDFRRISAMTAKMLEHNHYSGARIDSAMSAKIFDRYFDTLDPMRMLFSLEDVKKFADCRQDIGARLLRGECAFAFDVYEVYRRRYREFRQYTQEMLKKEIDFTVDEFLPAEPGKGTRPANESEMHELWRKRIKNDLLFFRLMEKAAAGEKNKKAAAAIGDKTPAERILQRQRDIGNDVEKRDKIDILGLLLDSMARSFGAHTDYQAPKLSEDFEINMSLSMSGIGATLTSENGYIKIVELVPGGPAAISGKLKVSDRIVTVTQENGEMTDLIDMPVSKAVRFIRGEKGTKVTLGILSGESSAPRQVVLTRDKFNLEAGAAKGDIRTVSRDGRDIKVGVITLPGFYMDFDAALRGDANAKRASMDVMKILQDFEKKKVDSVVIDLRRNGGGSLPDAIVLSGMFLSGNPVVQVRSKHELTVEKDPDIRMAYAGPLVVLTSKFSASAAEIFTGALRDSNRAVLVGDSRTFGKGTVLRPESLDRYNSWFGKAQPAGMLTFETAMFYRPSGVSVQQLGITPDILLPSLTEEMEVGEMFMDNHLPWDSIEAVKNSVFDTGFEKKVSELKKRSAARIAADPAYQALLHRIGQFRKIRKRKELSLNEKVRWQEYSGEKQVSDEMEAMESNGENKKESGGKGGDPVLNETVNIAADLFTLEKKQ